MSKDRSKDILKEIRSLRSELESRFDAIESRLAGGGRPAAKDGASVSEVSVPSASDRVPDPGTTPSTKAGKKGAAAAAATAGGAGALAADGRTTGRRQRLVKVIVSPLYDLGHARAVESSLNEAEGVESARLRSLSGDSAVIDAVTEEGVSVATSLRKHLPVAFDVADADEESITIALARPEEDPGNGAEGPVG